MGYIKHDAIIVTSWNDKLIKKAYKIAIDFFPQVTEITAPDNNNGYQSFFIPPDGSKEGWAASKQGDERRRLFIEACKEFEYDDGSTSLDIVQVSYDESGQAIVIFNKRKELNENATN